MNKVINVTVEVTYVEAARKALARLNRSAARHGIAISAEILAVSPSREALFTRTTRERGEEGSVETYLVDVVDLTVSVPAAPVRRTGWTLGAVAESTDAGLDLTVVDERARPVAARVSSTSFECAHCKARRNRSKVLVAIDPANNTVLLGTECAKAYVAEIDNDLFTLEFLGGVEIVLNPEADDRSSGGRVIRAWPLEKALAAASTLIAERGFTGRWTTDAYGERHENMGSTRNRVLSVLDGSDEVTAITEAARAEAAEVAAWLLALDPATQHDALRTAIDSATVGLVSTKKLGAVCWAVQARRSEIEAAAREAARKAAGADQNVAPEGRVAVEGRVLKVKEIDNGFGLQVKVLLELTAPAAHAFTRVYASAPSALGTPRAGDVLAFTATFNRAPDDARFAFGSRPTVKKVKVKA